MFETMDRLLWNFGQGLITSDQFFAALKSHGLTQDDIDLYLNGELR